MANVNFMLSKHCGICKCEKPADAFYKSKVKQGGLSWDCKTCDKKRKADYLADPKSLKKRNEAADKKYQATKVAVLLRSKENYLTRRAVLIERATKWRLGNPEKVRAAKRVNASIPLNKLKNNMRNRINGALASAGHYKKNSTQEIIGCDWYEFKAHIERQFTKGMSWERMGSEIHIDHICPMASAKTEEDVLALNHFTNLRPLWASENLQKSAKITHLI